MTGNRLADMLRRNIGDATVVVDPDGPLFVMPAGLDSFRGPAFGFAVRPGVIVDVGDNGGEPGPVIVMSGGIGLAADGTPANESGVVPDGEPLVRFDDMAVPSGAGFPDMTADQYSRLLAAVRQRLVVIENAAMAPA